MNCPPLLALTVWLRDVPPVLAAQNTQDGRASDAEHGRNPAGFDASLGDLPYLPDLPVIQASRSIVLASNPVRDLRMAAPRVIVTGRQISGLRSRWVAVPAREAFRMQARRVSIAKSGPTLEDHVFRIGRVGPEPEMAASLVHDAVNFVSADHVISDALPDIAGMKGSPTVCDEDASKLKSHSMGRKKDAACGDTWGIDAAIAVMWAPRLIWAPDRSAPEPTGGGLLNARPEPGHEVIGILVAHREPSSPGVGPVGVASTIGAYRMDFTI